MIGGLTQREKLTPCSDSALHVVSVFWLVTWLRTSLSFSERAGAASSLVYFEREDTNMNMSYSIIITCPACCGFQPSNFHHIFSSFLQLDEGTPPDPKGTFVDYQTTVVKYSKAIAVTAQEMVRQSVRTKYKPFCLHVERAMICTVL